MFGKNAARPGNIALKAGSINEKEFIKPQFNVFASRCDFGRDYSRI